MSVVAGICLLLFVGLLCCSLIILLTEYGGLHE